MGLTGIKHGGNSFMLGKSQKISDGVFRAMHTDSGNLYSVSEDASNEKLLMDETDPSTKILKEVEVFLASAEKYKKFNVPFKRGIVLYGPPGTGKTATVKMLSKLFVEKSNGIVIKNAGELEIANIYYELRGYEKTRPIMFVYDDIRAINQRAIAFMDGQDEIENVVFLFTTNYFNDLPPALKRPSRTDLHVEIKGMTENAAISFMKSKFQDEDFAPVKTAFKAAGIHMTYAILKEVMILRHVFGTEPDAALKRISKSGCHFEVAEDNDD